MTSKISNASAIAACDAEVDRLDVGSTNPSGKMRFYSGTPPTFVDDALSGNTLLAELDYSNPAYGSAVDTNPDARATASAISPDLSADATGTATFVRSVNRNGVAEQQKTVGVTGSGADIEMNSTAIQAGAKVECTSLTWKVFEN